MIVDALSEADRYVSLNSGLRAGFDFLRRPDLAELADGRYEIDGTRVFALVSHTEGRGQAGAKLEAHRKYLDIQLSLDGREAIGWRALATCQHPACEFDPERDIVFFRDAPTAWVALAPQEFAIFLPADAHAPLAGAGMLHKVVVKVAVE